MESQGDATAGTSTAGGLLTGEAVAVELPLARIGTRTLAIAIDAVVQIIALYLALFVLGGLVNSLDSAVAGSAALLVIILIFLVLPVFVETITRGRSLGKLALGLRVVRDDGGPIRFRHAAVRGLVSFALEWPGLLLGPLAPVGWLVGFTTLLFNRRAKRIGDLAAGTIVMIERLPSRGVAVSAVPYQLRPWAQTLDLTALDDELALALRGFVTRARDLNRPALVRLEAQLVQEVRAVTAPPPPPGVPPGVYLSTVLAERRRRGLQRSAERKAAAASYGRPSTSYGTPAPAYAQPRAEIADWSRPAAESATASSTTGFVAPA